jgi:hypothetical protein
LRSARGGLVSGTAGTCAAARCQCGEGRPSFAVRARSAPFLLAVWNFPGGGGGRSPPPLSLPVNLTFRAWFLARRGVAGNWAAGRGRRGGQGTSVPAPVGVVPAGGLDGGGLGPGPAAALLSWLPPGLRSWGVTGLLLFRPAGTAGNPVTGGRCPAGHRPPVPTRRPGAWGRWASGRSSSCLSAARRSRWRVEAQRGLYRVMA